MRMRVQLTFEYTRLPTGDDVLREAVLPEGAATTTLEDLTLDALHVTLLGVRPTREAQLARCAANMLPAPFDFMLERAFFVVSADSDVAISLSVLELIRVLRVSEREQSTERFETGRDERDERDGRDGKDGRDGMDDTNENDADTEAGDEVGDRSEMDEEELLEEDESNSTYEDDETTTVGKGSRQEPLQEFADVCSSDALLCDAREGA